MSSGSHVLIYWDAENAYSVVQRRKILSGLDDESLVGQTVSVLWKHETLQAEVISCGSKGDMRALEDAKVSEADQLSFLNCTDSTGQGLLPENSGTVEDSEAVNLDRDVGGINNPEISGIIQDSSPTIDPDVAFDKDVIIKSLETKLSNLEKRHRELKKSVASSSADKAKQKDIGSGVMVSSSFLTYIKLGFREDPPNYFRKLLFDSGLFELETIAAWSLNGKPSVVTKTTRPALDQKKLMAVKNYTIKMCNLHPRTFEMAEFDRRIKNVCSDARKKLASKQKKFE